MSTSKRSLADKIANGRLLTTRVRLTSAQVKALRATPIILVAGIPNRLLRFVKAELELKYGGTNAFTESTANLAIKYNNGSGLATSDTIETTGFIDQTADTTTDAVVIKDTIAAAANTIGKALVLHNIGAGEIAGNAANDNMLSVVISYVVNSIP